jgi:hypothetical protein
MYLTHLVPTDYAAIGLAICELVGQGTDNRTRDRAPLGVVTHTPSVTFSRKAYDDFVARNGRAPGMEEHDRHAAARFDVAKYQPNFLIGRSGLVCILDTEDQRAQHAGGLALECPAGDVYSAGTWRDWASPSDGSGWRRHGRDGRKVYDYWDAAFPGARSPLEVFPWGHFPNEAIGIDLLPDPFTGIYSPRQREAYVKLVRLLAAAHGFRVSDRTVTTHTLCSPCERGTIRRKDGTIVGVHWDPDSKVWPHASVLAEIAA